MRKFLLVLFIMITGLLSATELNPSATVIQNNSPDGYAVIRAAAITDWGTDHSMVLYTINNQSKSCMNVLELALAKTGDFNIFMEAVKYWSYPGEELSNLTILTEWLGDASFYTIFTLECDWTMVEYQYNNQVKSASKY